MSDEVTLPPRFVDRMVEVLGSRGELDALLEAQSRPGVRVNTLKSSVSEVRKRLAALGVETEVVPFAEDHLWVRGPDGEDLRMGQFWEHQAGHYYGQDAASRLPVLALDPQPGERVLDLCASPGGKSADAAARMQNEGFLVANETHPQRANMLVNNLDRCGVANSVVTRLDGTNLMFPFLFDKVLVDAPCSNLGGIHSDWGPVFKFTDHKVRTLSGMQRALLHTAFHACREGGLIAYSTCTLEPRENEGVASWFRENYPVEMVPVPVPVKSRALAADGDHAYHDEVPNAIRLHPGDVGTDGFFVALFRKTGDVPAEGLMKPRRPKRMTPAEPDTIQRIARAYGIDHPLIERAQAVSTGKRLYLTTIPDVEDAMRLPFMHMGLYFAKPEGATGDRLAFDAATTLAHNATETFELDEADARRWIGGEDLAVEGPREWRVITHGDEVLGAGRRFGGVFNSFVPKERRVPNKPPEKIGFIALKEGA